MRSSAPDVSWTRSSACGTSACVEVARVDGRYLVRMSTRPDGATLVFEPDQWVAFTAAIRAGAFD